MKTFPRIRKTFLSFIFFSFVFSVNALAASEKPPEAKHEVIKIGVKGMSCSYCAQGIKKRLISVDGVENVNPDVDKKIVELKTTKPEILSDEKLKQIIKDAGYEVTDITRK